MNEVGFTAGITLQDNRVFTVDVTGIDEEGIAYVDDEGPRTLPWADVKAVMLATPDHMLESGGYLFSMAELVREREEAQPYDATQMRQFGIGLLQQAAPRICPLGDACGLRPGPGAGRSG
jgi:hypothetical protein